MSCTLTKGRSEIGCRSNIGGVKAVYLFPFVDYTYNLIEGTRGVEITSFPTTTLYKYETTSANFSETITNDDLLYNGHLNFEKSFNVKLPDNLTINGTLDLAHSMIKELPTPTKWSH